MRPPSSTRGRRNSKDAITELVAKFRAADTDSLMLTDREQRGTNLSSFTRREFVRSRRRTGWSPFSSSKNSIRMGGEAMNYTH